MISREEVVSLYRLILDRVPESEQVINEKRAAGTIATAASEMITSEEFTMKHAVAIAAIVDVLR
jgi:hypothetical protein